MKKIKGRSLHFFSTPGLIPWTMHRPIWRCWWWNAQIIGLVFIIAGAVIQAAFKDYFAFFGNEINSASMFIIIIGVVCLIVSFFGCCGAYKENHCMVITVNNSRVVAHVHAKFLVDLSIIIYFANMTFVNFISLIQLSMRGILYPCVGAVV